MLSKEITIKQAATLAGVTVPTIHNWLKTGKIDKWRKVSDRRILINADCISQYSKHAVALRSAYEMVDTVLDTAVTRGDIYEIQKLRKALKLIVQHWDDVLSVSIENILQSITLAAAHQPSVYYSHLAPAINELTEYNKCN